LAGDKHVLSLNICTAVAPRDLEQKVALLCKEQRLTESVTQRADSQDNQATQRDWGGHVLHVLHWKQVFLPNTALPTH